MTITYECFYTTASKFGYVNTDKSGLSPGTRSPISFGVVEIVRYELTEWVFDGEMSASRFHPGIFHT